MKGITDAGCARGYLEFIWKCTHPPTHSKTTGMQYVLFDRELTHAVIENKTFFKFHVKDCFDYERDYYGSDVGQKDEVESPKDCQNLCLDNSKCRYWTFTKKEKVCYFKSANTGIRYSKEAVSGPKYCRLTGTIPSTRLYLLSFEVI